MGVLACDREYCENIMCDLVSDEYGRLCAECFEELVSLYMNDPKMSIAGFMSRHNRGLPALDRSQAMLELGAIFKYRAEW